MCLGTFYLLSVEGTGPRLLRLFWKSEGPLPLDSFTIHFDDNLVRKRWVDVIEVQRRLWGASQSEAKVQTLQDDSLKPVEPETPTLQESEFTSHTSDTLVDNEVSPRL
jgi:hypothetical protein